MRRTAPPTRTVAQVTTAAVLLVVAAALAGTASAILIHEVPASGGGSERVHFATGVHRHGDRSPVGYFPKDPNNAFWPEGPGMLTPTGMQQLRILGATFRERYHMQYGLVDANYTRRDFVYRSTDYDRTLMSAYSFLNGLYPYGTGPIAQNDLPGLPDRMQPVPVHTIPQSEDNLLRGYSRAQCRQLEVEYDARKTSDEWAAMEAKHADVLAQLPALTGLDDVSIDRMFAVHDPLVCDRAHNRDWPEGITQQIFEACEEMADFSLAQMFFSFEAARLSGGNLVGEFRKRIQAAADMTAQPGWSAQLITDGILNATEDDELGPRIAMFSAHDTTCAALLAALGVFDGKNPPYGSSVVFELVEYNENGLGDTDGVAVDPANLYVRAFYNRGVASIFSETFVVPGCSSHLCPLNEFFTNTQDIVPENWELECNGVEPMEPKEMSMGLAVLILTLCGLLGIAVGAGAVWYYRRSQERGRTFGRRRLTDDDELAEDEPRGDFGRTVELTDAAGQAARGSDAGGAV